MLSRRKSPPNLKTALWDGYELVKKWGAFYKPHSAVFKFGGLLRLLDINLTKQDKPISWV